MELSLECAGEHYPQENEAPWESKDCDDEFYYLSPDYISYRAGKPIGYWINKRLEDNKRLHTRSTLKEENDKERIKITNPLDYLGTPPDTELRWKK